MAKVEHTHSRALPFDLKDTFMHSHAGLKKIIPCFLFSLIDQRQSVIHTNTLLLIDQRQSCRVEHTNALLTHRSEAVMQG